MAFYESVFIARQDVAASQVESLTKSFSEIIQKNGGKVASSEYWGLRNLSHPINKNRKGHYTLLNIDAEPAAIAELERQMRFNEDVLRFLTVRVEELEKGPSAMLKQKQRDEGAGFGDSEEGFDFASEIEPIVPAV
ncbi:MAG: 30S ribosomal protein S6 [Dongiaceae bacterium]